MRRRTTEQAWDQVVQAVREMPALGQVIAVNTVLIELEQVTTEPEVRAALKQASREVRGLLERGRPELPSERDAERTRSADPFPLLEEVTDPRQLPTVAEWLDARAPLREVPTDSDLDHGLD